MPDAEHNTSEGTVTIREERYNRLLEQVSEDTILRNIETQVGRLRGEMQGFVERTRAGSQSVQTYLNRIIDKLDEIDKRITPTGPERTKRFLYTCEDNTCFTHQFFGTVHEYDCPECGTPGVRTYKEGVT